MVPRNERLSRPGKKAIVYRHAPVKKQRPIRPSANTRLTDSLNQLLADSYALLSLTHLAHWNVEGPRFFALHTAFQT